MNYLKLENIKIYDIETVIDFNGEKAVKAAQEINDVCNLYNNRPNKDIRLTMENINDIGKADFGFLTDLWHKFLDDEYKANGLPYNHTAFNDPIAYHSITDTDRIIFAMAKAHGYTAYENLVKDIKEKSGVRNYYAPTVASSEFLRFDNDGNLVPNITERGLSEKYTTRAKDNKDKAVLKLLRKVKAELKKHGIDYLPSNIFNYDKADELFRPAQFNDIKEEYKE
jgi:hypothetical protein